MATKDLKVDELRDELTKRGLSIAGIKPTLVRRLEAAIRDESEKLVDAKARKRQRDCEADDGDSEAPQKKKAMDELRGMTVKQLREEASTRGISVAGTKQELLERLSATDDENASDGNQVEEQNKEENVVSNAPQNGKAIDELQRMNVKQLREEASTRGMSAAGTKQELLERLSAADDNNQVMEENKEENVASDTPQKVKAIDELQRMNIKQLRKEASTRGISAVGTKQELLDRLSAAVDENASDNDQVKGENVASYAPKKVMNIDELEGMNIKQLREEASTRGISAAGTKLELLERLSAADDKNASDNDHVEEENKEENVASGAPQKVKAIDELQKMNIKQLREEAITRGISAAGTKQELLERIITADDNNQVKEENVASNAQQKVEVIDELQKMNVKQLRKEASTRGISAAGTKQELLERLSAADDKNASDNDQVEEENKEENVASTAPQKVKAIDELQKMNVKQLREEAATRGISTSGTKKEFLDRLSTHSDNVSPDDNLVGEEIKEENVASDTPQEVKAIDELQRMNIKQLREEAATRGISTIGTKKELLNRLCSHDVNVSPDDNLVKEEAKEEKIVKTVKKGSAVMDSRLPDSIKTQYHVLQVGDEIYDAMLNQTNLGQNNNKFFVIQALESDDGGRFMVYFRWGRVGVMGQDKLNGPYTSQEAAIDQFEKKFYDKTWNRWWNRRKFVKHPNHYTWLEMDYSESGNEPPPIHPGKELTRTLRPEESKVEPRIAKFISLICNMSMMKQQMMEIGYNAEKLPLGKLSKATVLKGYNVLKSIADVIGHADRMTLEQLSGDFYTVIPHDFGFRKTSLFIIDTPQKLKMKLEMVEALGEIEVAMKLIEEDTDTEDPLCSQYRRLHCELMPIEVQSEEYSMIEKYTKNTHAKTHSSYDVDIIQIFKVSREGESEQFHKFTTTKNRMLLWHGSRLTNWMGILSQGLRIAPPEAPSTGYMFGKGVYFADMFSKSANYCFPSQAASTGVLLLCEVALGDMTELQTANYDADKLPPGKLSTKGVGATAPDFSEARILEDGVVVPLGTPKEQRSPKGSLLYNEYIVYNVEQIRMRYLVQVNFNFK